MNSILIGPLAQVVYSDKVTGRALVIQDINAPNEVCMRKIRDLKNYDKYVSQVRAVNVYNEKIHANVRTSYYLVQSTIDYYYIVCISQLLTSDILQMLKGTVSSSARFDVSAMTMGFRYWLALTYEPAYATYTWTLDYNFESDFGAYLLYLLTIRTIFNFCFILYFFFFR
jgi:hypothetical protein